MKKKYSIENKLEYLQYKLDSDDIPLSEKMEILEFLGYYTGMFKNKLEPDKFNQILDKLTEDLRYNPNGNGGVNMSKSNDKTDKQVSPVRETNSESLIDNKTEKHYGRGQHPNSLSNLKPYKKGTTGNPGGRVKNYENMVDGLKKFAKGKRQISIWDPDIGEYIDDYAQYNLKEEVLLRIWLKAIEGDPKFITLLAQLGCLDD